MDTVQIDLNDLELFCREQIQSQESQNPDMLESLLGDLESNALRYMKYFYEAADQEQPDKDDDFNMENAALAKDAINRWRERSWRDRQDADGAPDANGKPPAIPARMK